LLPLLPLLLSLLSLPLCSGLFSRSQFLFAIIHRLDFVVGLFPFAAAFGSAGHDTEIHELSGSEDTCT